MTLSAWSCLMALGLCGCGAPDACHGLERGKEYDFVLRQGLTELPLLIRPSSFESCGKGFDLAVGDVLTVRATTTHYDEIDDCESVTGELVGGVDLQRTSGPPRGIGATGHAGPPVFELGHMIQRGECPGTWGLTVLASTDNVFSRHDPNDPDVVLYRTFFPKSLDDPAMAEACTGFRGCADAFGVEVRRHQ